MLTNLKTTFNAIFAFLLRNHEAIWGEDYDAGDSGNYPQRIIKNLIETKHLAGDGRYIKLVYLGHRVVENFPIVALQIRYYGLALDPAVDLLNDTRLEPAVDTLETVANILAGSGGYDWTVLTDTIEYSNLGAYSGTKVDNALYALNFEVRYH